MNINPMDFMKNFQNIQSKLSEAQDKLKDIRVTGSAGGGMVKIDMNGQMAVVDVTIDKDAVDPDDIEMLEDLVLAAITDAITKTKEQVQKEMSGLTGGLDLPPGILGT